MWAPLLALLLAIGWRRAAMAGAAVLTACSFVDVVILQHATSGTERVLFGTDDRAGAFLVGGRLALAWSRPPDPSHRWIRVCTSVVVLCVAVLVVTARVFDIGHPVSPVLFGASWVAVSVAGPLLVVALIGRRRRSGRSFLASPVLTYVGQRSYALYLWHYVWLTWFRDLGLVGVVLAFAASFVSAEISWRLVEARALVWKTRLAGAATPPTWLLREAPVRERRSPPQAADRRS